MSVYSVSLKASSHIPFLSQELERVLSLTGDNATEQIRLFADWSKYTPLSINNGLQQELIDGINNEDSLRAIQSKFKQFIKAEIQELECALL